MMTNPNELSNPVARSTHALGPSQFAAFDRIPLPTFVLEMIDRHEPNSFRCCYVNSAFRTLAAIEDAGLSSDECFPINSVLLATKYLEAAAQTRAAITFEDRLTVAGHVLNMTLEPVFDNEGRASQFVGCATDVSDKSALSARLEFIQNHDELTGLANRNTLWNRLHESITQIDVFDVTVGLIVVDLDDFSVVNDSLGHAAGDEVIVTLARRIEGVLRFGDLVTRLGGDEFGVICNDVESLESVLAAAQRIIDVIAEPISTDDGELRLHASAGVVLALDADDDPNRLLRDADVALSNAKRQGRNRVAVFDSQMRHKAVQRLGLEQDLHRALRDDEFRVVYQPLVRLSTGEIAGFEALLRWHHPTQGLLNPTDFIPIAEQNGIIVEIGERVIVEVCQQAAKWQELCKDSRPLITSINLSARQLAHPDLVGVVAGAISQAGLSPSAIELEVTESILMADPVLATTILHALRALGVQLAVDDFGTGHSSLGYLKQLPVHTLKIDKSFVDGLGIDRDDSAIVAAVVSMGHALGMSVTAEGIETVLQRDVLSQLGCDLGQGFYFAKPQPASVSGALVSRRLRWISHNARGTQAA